MVGLNSIYLLRELAEPTLNEVNCNLDGLAVSRLHYIKFIVPFPLQTLPPFQVTKRRDVPGLTQLCAGWAGAVASHRPVGVPLSGQTRCLTLPVATCRCAVNACVYTAH